MAAMSATRALVVIVLILAVGFAVGIAQVLLP